MQSMNLHQHISQNKNCIICDNQLSFLVSDRRKSFHHTQDAVSVKFDLLRKFNNSVNFNYNYDYNFTSDNNFYVNFYKGNELLHHKVPLFLIKNLISIRKTILRLYENCQSCKNYTSCYSIYLNWKLAKIDSINLDYEILEFVKDDKYKILNSYKENYTYVTFHQKDESVKFPLVPLNMDLDSYLNKIDSYLLLK